MIFDEEIRKATLKNLTAKSKIMAIIFTFVLFVQFCFLIYIIISKSDFLSKVPSFAPYLAFALIFCAFLTELYTYRYLKNRIVSGKVIKNHVPYFVTLLEISFPTIILSYAGFMMVNSELQLSTQLLSSPPAIMYFIMIALSALMLDKRLCVICGILAAVEYLVLSLIILDNTSHGEIDLANQIGRAGFLLLAGIISGYVSSKIKEAMLESLEAKNKLIHKLDKLVNEKTAEIQQQKEEIETKQREIIDSIKYARRIQTALMPTDKRIDKQINKVKRK